VMRFHQPVLVVVLAGLAFGLTTHADELPDDEVAAYKSAWSSAIEQVTPDGYLYEEFGTYQASFRPGGDRESLVDFVPRQPASGIETNAQCLFCHVRPHDFEAQPHADLVDSGELRCIDCHMAIYNVTESGRKERYHNMKVAANNDPATCRPCHDYDETEISARCSELVRSFSSQAHAVPPFE